MPKQKIKFKIERIDSLGQGVSKQSGPIQQKFRTTFVRKTLPGEEGIAAIFRQKGKVSFAELETLLTPSPFRIKPICPHYTECSGCHYLHTDYEHEQRYKTENFTREIQRLGFDHPINFVPAPNRLGYRNRLQLHYDLKQVKIGFLDSNTHSIIEVPHCLLPNKQVELELKKLYHNNQWIDLVKSKTPVRQQGHIEIFDRGNQVSIELNAQYAFGGFEQVNDQMNQTLQKKLVHAYKNLSSAPGMVLDLFGGSGNLSKEMKDRDCLVIDAYQPRSSPKLAGHQSFLKINLYSNNALTTIKKQISSKPCFLAIIDPPRSGLKNLSDFIETFTPNYLIYISCNWATMLRDITPLLKSKENDSNPYKIIEADILDFFPSTYHFECFLILERVKKN